MLQSTMLDEVSFATIDGHLVRIRSLREEIAEKEAHIAEVARARDHSRAQYDALKVEHSAVLERLEVLLKAPGSLQAAAAADAGGSRAEFDLAEARRKAADLQGSVIELEANAVEAAKVCVSA
jgi:ElaB/YqjD/DUF883 family membrane-anchored ribosome-binding protein